MGANPAANKAAVGGPGLPDADRSGPGASPLGAADAGDRAGDDGTSSAAPHLARRGGPPRGAATDGCPAQDVRHEAHGRKLANLPGNSSHPIHGVLALHTLLVDAYPERHPESRMRQPTTGEVQAAMRLVDRLFRTGIFRELCRMTEAPTRMEPPFFVARLYGWDVDCEILQAMRHERDTATPGADPRRMQQLREEIFRTENHLVRGAERTIEGMPEMSVPRSYVERLESELNTLGWLVRRSGAHRRSAHKPAVSRQIRDPPGSAPGGTACRGGGGIPGARRTACPADGPRSPDARTRPPRRTTGAGAGPHLFSPGVPRSDAALRSYAPQIETLNQPQKTTEP